MGQERGPDQWNGLERRVIHLVGQGLTDPEISAELLMSERTVQRLVNIIQHNLGLTDRLDFILFGSFHILAARRNPPARKKSKGGTSFAVRPFKL